MVLGRFSALLIVTCMLCAAFAAVPLGARAEQGETDTYGYRWTDSDSPTPSVTFEWVDITSSGTDTGVSGDDDAFGPYLIGFPFEFYGVEYTELYISTNGLITFEGPESTPAFDPIPTSWGINGFVAPFWSNLCVDYGGYNTGTVFYETIGATPNQQTVIEFYEVSYIDSYDLMTFEVILNETGEIWFNYLTLNGWVGDYASVGIEDLTGYVGTEYSFAAPNLHDGLAVMFSVAAVAIGPDGTMRGAAGTAPYHVVYVSNHQAFDDTFELTNITDNGWPITMRDEAWSIVTDTDGDLVQDTGMIPAGSSKIFYVEVSIPIDPAFRSENITVTATSAADDLVGDRVYLTTTVNLAEFGWPFTEYANDTDSDGYYDSLEIRVPTNIAFGGDYRLTGWLYQDSTFAYVTQWSTVHSLSAGSYVLVVPFDGSAIRSSALDGPYFVGLQLADLDWIQIDSDGFTTGAYAYTEFQPPPAEFVLPFPNVGNDSDGDGPYDTYDIDVQIQVNVPGDYDVRFYFKDPWYNTLWSSESVLYLDAGLQTIRYAVPGPVIYGEGNNGVYHISTELYDETVTWTDTASQDTPYLTYLDFESETYIVPPVSDYGLDIDGDLLYDVLVVEATVNSSVAGDYYLQGYLYNETLVYLTGANTIVTIEVGSNTVSLQFPSLGIYAAMYNGTFGVEFDLYDMSWDMKNYYQFMTSAYTYDQFDPPGAMFTPPHDEHTTDGDDDGLFDSLVVEAEMMVNGDGSYVVRGYLYDSGWNFIMLIQNNTVLASGAHTVELEYDAWTISAGMYDGPYYVSLLVYDDAWSLLDQDQYTTAAYTYDQFEPVPASITPPLTEYVIDFNSNMLYDYLAVEVTVDVVDAGDYVVSGYLYDQYSDYIGYVSNTTYLDLGAQVVPLLFQGQLIFNWGVDGPYYVYVELYTGSYYYLDWADIYTDAYLCTEFEDIVAEFAPPHDDWGVDEEPDGLYDYLRVDVSINVNVSLDYYLEATVYDWAGSFVCYAEEYAYLDTGLQYITLEVDSALIYQDLADGPYEIFLELYDTGTWTLQDTDTYYTAYYSYAEFEALDASFEAPHSAVAVGGMAEPEYAALVLTINVSVLEAGEYTIRMWLYDYYWEWITYEEKTVDLAVGLQSVEFYIPGWRLAVIEADGPYQVDLNLFDSAMTFLDYDFFSTPEYLADEFDQTVPMIVSGWTFSAPTVDGAIDPDEWADATAVDLMSADPANELDTTLLVMHNLTHLFLCFDVTGDVTEDSLDTASVTFDTGLQDFLTDGEEDQFVIDGGGFWDGTMHSVFDTYINDWAVDCWPFDDSRLNHEGLAGAIGFGGSDLSAADHRIYEFAIPLALLGVSLDDVLGFCTGGFDTLGVMDGSADITSEWPAKGSYPELVEWYGDLSIPSLPVTTTASLDGTPGLHGWYVSEVEVSFSAVAMGPIDFTMYSTDGGTSWTEYTSPFTLSDDGEHEIEFYSVDMGANEEEHKTVTVRIDTAAPTCSGTPTGTLGLEGWYVSAVVIETDASDPAGGSGVSEIMYRVDSGSWHAVSGVSVTMSIEGSHTVEYYSLDVAGNAEEAHNVTVKVDTVAPITTASVDGSVVNLTAAEASSGLWITLYRIDGGTWTEYTTPFEVAGAGNHTVEFYSSDVAGNNETVRTLTVEVGGGRAVDLFGLPWYLWTALAAALMALMVVMAVRKIYGMTRKAKDSDSRAVIKDIGSPVSQMMDDAHPRPPGEEPPPPVDDLDRLAEELDRK